MNFERSGLERLQIGSLKQEYFIPNNYSLWTMPDLHCRKLQISLEGQGVKTHENYLKEIKKIGLKAEQLVEPSLKQKAENFGVDFLKVELIQNSKSNKLQDLKLWLKNRAQNFEQEQNNTLSDKEKKYLLLIFEKPHKTDDAFIEIMDQIKFMEPNYVEMMRQIHKRLKTFSRLKADQIRYGLNKAITLYKNKYVCQNDSRFKYKGGFKSLNEKYLKALFKDPFFAQCYQQIAFIFGKEYEEQNLEKIQNIIELVKKNRNNQLSFTVRQFLNRKQFIPESSCLRRKTAQSYLAVLEENFPDNVEACEAIRQYINKIK